MKIACETSRDFGAQSADRRSRYHRRASAAICGTGTRPWSPSPRAAVHAATSSSDRKSRMVDQVKPMSSHQRGAGTPTWTTAPGDA